MSALVTHKDTEGAPLAWKGSVFCRGKRHFRCDQCPGKPAGQNRNDQPNVHNPASPCPYGPFQYTGSGRRRHGGQFLLGHKSKGQYRQQDIYNEAANKTHDRGLAYVILALGPI